MGCSVSSSRRVLPTLSEDAADGPLTTKEIAQRIVASRRTQVLRVRGDGCTYTAKYACVSQRGYYPHDLDKANQDASFCHARYLGDENVQFFGVFDGHGPAGDDCAKHVRRHLAGSVGKELKATKGTAPSLSDKTVDRCLRSAFANTNASLRNSTIDDKLSGTTAVTALLRGSKLTVCNVGDSRAIIGTEDVATGTVRAAPLSIDQTPFRADERERVKACGARIMTMEQIEGNEPIHENWGLQLGAEVDESGDPPRVWNRELERPGCAFTRSLGDAIAKGLGVTAEPEITARTLTDLDRYIVLASDGVFEFMTSQAVMDVVAEAKDPLEACRAVVAEAYRLWLQWEVRTDDITVICIALHDMAFDEEGLREELRTRRDCAAQDDAGAPSVCQRPVRRTFSAGPRGAAEESKEPATAAGAINYDAATHRVRKTDEEKARIRHMVASNFLFHHLSGAEWDDVLSAFDRVHVAEGQDVITQGDEGDRFYVVDSGRYLVSVQTPAARQRGDTPVVVMEYSRPGDAFGELSLMNDKPRAATVTVAEGGMLWALDRDAFRALLLRRAPQPGC